MNKELEDKILNGTEEITLKELAKVLVAIHKDHSREIEYLTKELNEKKKEIVDLKTRVNQLEINNVRNNVILKDLPLHTAARLGK